MSHRLLSLLRRSTGDRRPDAELLTKRHDPAVFTEIVARHGPMVWGVCRHTLGDADAEDAFQATFVALLRSAIRDGSSLAAWLHGVAVRVSLAARREAGRRRAREQAAAAPEAAPAQRQDDWTDTMVAIHREIAALSDADRSAFVLCVLEGLTQAEAAVRLGRTSGAVAGQVGRAKKRLVARLTRRGIVPSFVALGTPTAAGAVPQRVMVRTLDRSGAGISPTVLRLATGGSRMTASSTKLLLGAAVLVAGLSAGLLAAGGETQVTVPQPVGKAPLPAGAPRGEVAREEPPKLGQETKPRQLVGPVLDFVRLSKVDETTGHFEIVRTVEEYVTRIVEVEVERGGNTVRERKEVTGAVDREITEGYTLKYWRLADKRGVETGWEKSAGKTVLLYRSNEMPGQEILRMLSGDAVILYGRN